MCFLRSKVQDIVGDTDSGNDAGRCDGQAPAGDVSCGQNRTLLPVRATETWVQALS
jgi:hypothetical protein